MLTRLAAVGEYVEVMAPSILKGIGQDGQASEMPSAVDCLGRPGNGLREQGGVQRAGPEGIKHISQPMALLTLAQSPGGIYQRPGNPHVHQLNDDPSSPTSILLQGVLVAGRHDSFGRILSDMGELVERGFCQPFSISHSWSG
jgi:hypothetical protein